jgi:sensor domain CHASE-containing protein
MLIEITVFNKKQKPLYSFLIDLNTKADSAQELMTCIEEDLDEIINKELSKQPKGYYGIAKNFKTDVEYYASYAGN